MSTEQSPDRSNSNRLGQNLRRAADRGAFDRFASLPTEEHDGEEIVAPHRSRRPVERPFPMRLCKAINDGAPIRIDQTELVEEIGIAIHPGDRLGAPLIVEAHAHQCQTFDDRAIARKLLQRRRHDTGPLLKQVQRVRTRPLFQLIAQKNVQRREPIRPWLGAEYLDDVVHHMAHALRHVIVQCLFSLIQSQIRLGTNSTDRSRFLDQLPPQSSSDQLAPRQTT
jgi:hypothetical protein